MLACFLGAGDLRAQGRAERDMEFWSLPRRQRPAAAAELVLCPSPITMSALLMESRNLGVWIENDFLPKTVPPLNPDYLSWIKDNTPTPDPRFLPPDKISKEKQAYIHVVNQAMVNSFDIPLETFIESAKDNEHVGFAHMWNQPDIYRGKVVAVKGRLIRLRKWDADMTARQNGIRYQYEGWIMPETKKTNPYWVMFPHLPEGIKPAEDMDKDVTFYGYFLKKIKYVSGEKKEATTLLFVGPTVLLADKPAVVVDPPLPIPVVSLIVVGIGILVMGILVFSFSWWFKRTDRIHKRVLDQIRLKHQEEALAGNDLPWLDEKPGYSTEPAVETGITEKPRFEDPTVEEKGKAP